jgi:hypothetical protein
MHAASEISSFSEEILEAANSFDRFLTYLQKPHTTEPLAGLAVVTFQYLLPRPFKLLTQLRLVL